MISYADVESLPDEQYARVRALIDAAQALYAAPSDLGTVRAWGELAQECEEEGFMHLVASAHFNQYSLLSGGGLVAESLEAFEALLGVIETHGDLVDPRNVDVQLNTIGTAASVLVDDPSVPLERIAALTDRVEAETRRRGVDVTGAHVSRATIAAAAGDADGTRAWIDRWRAEAGPGWQADDAGVIQIEVPLIATFDAERAARTLEDRLPLLGVDLSAIDVRAAQEHPELIALLAHLRVRQGRRAEATAIADSLVEVLGIDRLVRSAVAEHLLSALEERPELAVVAVDRLLNESPLDHTGWEGLAAAARSRILADPDGDEGALLRALAEDGARAHDRRGATTVHTRALQELWWAGLPESPRPAILDDPEVWGDVESRAEHVLRAGLLRRAEYVRSDDPPVALGGRYQELLREALGLMSLETAEAVDAEAERLTVRALELRCATTQYAVPLLHSLGAGQRGDDVTFVASYRRAQEQLRMSAPWLSDTFRAMGERFFALVVEHAVATPETSWSQVEDLIRAEIEVREITHAPASPILLAQAELAAHLDDLEQLTGAHEALDRALADEADQVDRPALELEIVRLCARLLPEVAEVTAERVARTGDEEQVRAAAAWLCWFRPDDEAAAVRLREVLAEVDGDVEELGPVPGWVVLEAAVRAGSAPVPLVDALLEASDGSASDRGLFAAAGSALMALAPEDPRGPELREKAAAITRALGVRDGSALWSTWVGDRWFPGDPAFGEAAVAAAIEEAGGAEGPSL